MCKRTPYTAKTLRQYQTHEYGNPIPRDVCPYGHLSHTKHTDYAVAEFLKRDLGSLVKSVMPSLKSQSSLRVILAEETDQ